MSKPIVRRSSVSISSGACSWTARRRASQPLCSVRTAAAANPPPHNPFTSVSGLGPPLLATARTSWSAHMLTPFSHAYRPRAPPRNQGADAAHPTDRSSSTIPVTAPAVPVQHLYHKEIDTTMQYITILGRTSEVNDASYTDK